VTLTLPDLLEALGHAAGDHVAICEQPPGGVFSSRVVASAEAPADLPDDRNLWFGVNPITGPERANAGRGTADQVLRLVALYADLDVKPGGLDSFDTAHTVIDVLSDMLGSRPVACTLSGNGLQPYWPLDDDVAGTDAAALLRRFGRLVRRVAETHHGHVDSVYDLARVLRAPGSHNLKGAPKAVLTIPDVGHPLTVTEIAEALDAYGIGELPEDRDRLGAVVSDTSGWTWAPRTCIYAKTMVASWASDSPDARHPWLVSQATRLAAARRLGCITEADHRAAVDALAARFTSLLATGQARPLGQGEIADAITWGETTVSTKTDDAARRELGEHDHDDKIMQLVPDQPGPLTVIHGGQHGSPGQHSPGQQASPTAGTSALSLALAAAPSTLERSEDGHAQQLIDTYGDLIRYCHERGRWLVWSGARWVWQPPGGGQVREYAKNVARTLPQGDQAALSHKRKCLSSNGISGCLKQAETDHRVIVSMADLDADPWTLNTPAGAVNLRTGTTSPPDPASLCTKTTSVAPNPEPDPVWQSFLDDTFGDDHALRDYVQRLVGLTLIGQVREQLLAFLHGQGANGKSTLAETLMHALGVGETGYAIAAPSEMLMIRKHSEHPAELAQLAGARMVVCSELDDGQKFAESRIKHLTGRDSINARFLYGQPFTFLPSHTIWLLGNHRPQARTGGMAFWRRVKLLEFARVVPEERRDPALGDKLNAAAGTVLAWAIAGALDYLSGGIREPRAVAQAVAAYAEDQDTIGRFVADGCHRADSELVRVPATRLREAYEVWCREAGEEPASAKRLGQELRDRFGVVEKRSNGRRFYTRIALLEEEQDSAGSGTDEQAGWWQR
jgi:P4 family phage/plasmid primase-like protien